MKSHIIAVTLAIAGASAYAQATPQRTSEECGVKPSEYFDMSFREFDQTMGAGWRKVADQPGCDIAAADLIAQFREWMVDNAAGLDWHEAQGRAIGGQTDRALELFQRNLEYEKSKPPESRSEENIIKAEATVAFLAGDLNRLREARDRLLAMPKPDDFDKAIARFKERYPGLTPPTWPLNLRDVDAFITCFGKSYAEAYGECRKQSSAN